MMKLMIACGAMVVAMSAQAAHHDPDPARWYQEDVTVEQRLKTIQKETKAAFRENMNVCRAETADGSAARKACISEARSIFMTEWNGARNRALTDMGYM